MRLCTLILQKHSSNLKRLRKSISLCPIDDLTERERDQQSHGLPHNTYTSQST